MSTIAAGTRLGGCTVTAALGAGGMGEVFRARDTRLDRDVAIKVLPAAFASDPERLARFEREAKLLASLNHPNIAHVYGFEGATLEDGSGVHFLAMELVEGEDLAERLKRGAVPVDEALAIAKQIAEALEEAHEKGIVHRDLKPANVKVTEDGKVKVLDFGLAKAMTGDPMVSSGGHDLSQSPTLASPGTQAGLILGTAAYMSPEQARGKPVDKRADIWAFAVVLLEMLTGRQLFKGETVSDTLAAVLKDEIPWSRLAPDTPRAAVQVLKRCLARDPRERLRDIGDARLALSETDDVRQPPAASPPSPRGLARRAVPWVAGFALGALAVGALDRTLLPRATGEPPKQLSLSYSGSDSLPTVSPDGRMVAFASTRDGRSRIWLKQLATGEEVALTSGPTDLDPRFSPDGSTLLFLRGAAAPFSLFQVPAVGGTARRVADGVATSAAWSPDGRRVALTRASMPGGVPDLLVTLALDGGDERELARVTEFLLSNLRWSPDGSTIGALTGLTTNPLARQTIVGFDAASGARRTLYDRGPDSVLGAWSWSGSRALVFTESVNPSGRGGGGTLRRFEIGAGAPTTLLSLREPAAGLDIAGPGRVVLDAFSPTQSLSTTALAPGSKAQAPARLTRGDSIDRQPVFSPDGTRIAFSSDREGDVDLWELELASGQLRRLTTARGDDWDPAYSPDGQQLLWSSKRTGHYEVWIAASDGSGARQVSADGVDAENPAMTPDRRWIVYASANPSQNGIWKVRPDGTEASRLVQGSLGTPEISPDGRWVSFVDNENSRLRVVALADAVEVAAFDVPVFATVVGALTPGRHRWIPGSSTLVWLEYDNDARASRLVLQEVVPGRDTRASRRLLVAGSFDDMPESFAVSPDGRQLVVSSYRARSNLLLIEGLPGVTR
jgi:eukaryotic-like serine/threonine-protein kinase